MSNCKQNIWLSNSIFFFSLPVCSSEELEDSSLALPHDRLHTTLAGPRLAVVSGTHRPGTNPAELCKD